MTLSYYTFLNNSEGYYYFTSFDNSKNTNNQRPFEIRCPENISTYTDLNLCSSDISNSLNIITPDSALTNLTWEMTGANTDISPSTGINHLNNYLFDEGSTTITYTGKDLINNTATCSFTVIVSDNQAPRIANPLEDITVGTDYNDCGAVVRWNELITIDNCRPSNQIIQVSSHTSGSRFPIGTTEVVGTISDGIDYNVISYSFFVTVADNEAPLLIAPENIILNCNNEIPQVYLTWDEFNNAGGIGTDNCNVETSSFKFVSQEQDSVNCPYIIRRTYQITDIYGNIGDAVHSIQVTDDEIILKSGTDVQANPTATISGGGTICAGGSAIISVLLTGSQPWSITYTDGTTPVTVNNISSSPHTINVSPGDTKTYTLTAVSDIDGSGTFAGSALVTVNPVPDVTATPASETICSGDATNIILSGTVAGTTFSWTVNQSGVSGATNASGNSIVQTLITTGTTPGTAIYTITPSANGCTGVPIGVTVTLDPLPTASSGGSQTICSFETATVSGASFSNGTVLWTHNGLGSLSNETTITPTYSAVEGDEGNTITLTLTVTSNNACGVASATAIYTVYVEALPTVTADAGGSDIICSNSSTTVSGASSSGGAILWTHNGSGLLTNETTISPTYSAVAGDEGNTVTLTLNVTGINACGLAIATASHTIVVDPLPTATAGGSETICSNGSATVSGASSSDGTILWTHNGAGSLTNETTITPSYSAVAGDEGNTIILTLTVTSNNACGTAIATATYTVLVDPLPTAAAGGSETICSNGSAAVSGASSSNGTILWTHNGAGSLTNETTITPTYSAVAGDDGNIVILTMTVTSGNSCSPQSALATFTITILESLIAPIVSSNQTICYNKPPSQLTATAATGGSSPYSYQWQDSIDGGSWSDILGETALNYSPPALITTTYFRIRATDAGSPSCGLEISNTVEILVVDDTPPSFKVPRDIILYSDVNCNVITDSTITGIPIDPADICTDLGDLIIFHSDGSNIAGGCTGNYSFIRSWTVSDEAGNSTTETQTITIIDNVNPILSIPPTKSITCSESTLPANTGQATAIDNCGGTVNITYSDNIIPGTCIGRYDISRTWTATDDCGNFVTGVQSINVSDNIPPEITSVTNLSVPCPEDIPDPDSTGIVATDACGVVTIELWDEISNGLEGQPGFCPTSISRTWRITDQCGNYIDTIQTIIIEGPCGCAMCATQDSYFWIDMLGAPDSTVVISDVERQDYCCDYTKKSDCVSFNIRLDDDAVGVEILIDGATPSPQDWRIDCGSVEINDDVVCVPGGEFHLFSYCKPGVNLNTFNFVSIQGIVISKDIQTRVDCQGQLVAEGIASDPEWTSISPGNVGDYDHYLSSTTIYNPLFTAQPGSPSVIEYQICGNIGSVYCTVGGVVCDTITVYVKEAIDIELDINPDMVCENIIPVITPDIAPASTYVLTWYSGYDESGALLHTGPSYTPTGEGAYSVTATDIDAGIPCSSETFNFDIIFDYTGPTLQAPPYPLEIKCNCNGAAQIIQDWLALATASYVAADSSIVEFTPSNDYAGITMTCGEVVTVSFTAFDQCSNDSTLTSTITVTDTIPPTISCPPDASNVADHDSCLIVNFDVGTPTYSDDCDTPILTWEKTGATNETGTGTVTGPFNVGVTIVTYTAADLCGNFDTCQQTVTIIDAQPPDVINCPPDVIVTAPLPDCDMEVLVIDPPAYTDNCGEGLVTLSWVKTGATENSGTGDVNGTSFNVGVTIVTYTITDAYGNSATCSFTVTVNDEVPPEILTCPDTLINLDATPGTCELYLTLDQPTAFDPCGQSFTITHDSPYGIAPDDASGSYPVGSTVVTWSVTDESGNISTCVQTIIINDTQPPVFTFCPPDEEQQIIDGGCFLSNAIITDPTFSDNCGIDLLIWEMSGATNGTSPLTGINYVSGETFNVGITNVTYIIFDASGLSDTCSFNVWIRNLIAPQFSVACPADITVDADSGECSAYVTVSSPVITNPCNEFYTMIHDSVISVDSTDASGTYPIGTTTITWTIVDASGNITVCTQLITVNDLLPTLTCPPDLVVQADYEQPFASGVTLLSPTFDDNCPDSTLTWIMTGATTGTGNTDPSGINIVPSPNTFNLGVTTIEYTFTDFHGHVDTCSFTVTVESEPIINCPPDTTVYVASGLCINNFDPGIPDLIQGAAPIDWTWEMTGATIGFGSTTGATPLPDLIGPVDFNVGTTTITWIAENLSGIDSCSYLVNVIDTIQPAFTTSPLTECVDFLYSAVFTSANPNPNLNADDNLILNPSPDYFTFISGNTALDLITLDDNCCDSTSMTIDWRIDFSNTPDPLNPPSVLIHAFISGTGQPSTYGSNMYFPGDGVYFTNITHIITYWVTDCNGNISETQTENIVITPRPELIKQN